MLTNQTGRGRRILQMSATRILPWYYAATLVFLLLDFFGGVNVRVAFLDTLPAARVAYYGICFACLGLMIWRPAWTTLIGTFESLVTMVALIFGMALRVMVPNDVIVEENIAIVTSEQLVNFIIAGSIAYLSWVKGLKALTGR